MSNFYKKYLKYKNKYLNLKSKIEQINNTKKLNKLDNICITNTMSNLTNICNYRNKYISLYKYNNDIVTQLFILNL